MNKIFCIIFILLTTASCTRRNENLTKVIIYTKAPVNRVIKIIQIPYFNEQKLSLASGRITDNHDSLVYFIPTQGRLIRIELEGDPMQVEFINDSKRICVRLNYFDHTYTVTGSPATSSLIKFERLQQNNAVKLRSLLSKRLTDIKYTTDTPKLHDYNQLLKIFFKNYVAYADTVKSAAAFIKVYNTIDFDKDYLAEKKFILHAKRRFAKDAAIQRLCLEALKTVDIYEQEFKIGDKLPTIKLPDQNDILFTTDKLKRKFYLIDFWTTYCTECLEFKQKEKSLLKDKFIANKINLVSVALDDDKDKWQSIVKENQYNWPQLIDIKMWQGTAVETLKFDSIPFNFLVDPSGKIVAKAISGRQLKHLLNRLL